MSAFARLRNGAILTSRVLLAVLAAIFGGAILIGAVTNGVPWLTQKANLTWWHWLMLIGMFVLTWVLMSIGLAIEELRKSLSAQLEDQRQRQIQADVEVISALLDIARNTENGR